MEYPVVSNGSAVGSCSLTEEGLYWQVRCSCQLEPGSLEHLYCGGRSLGILEPGVDTALCRRVSRASWPELPPKSGSFSLQPEAQPVPWSGTVAGCRLEGMQVGDQVLFPYDPEKPCPCEPLICFFTIRDGFWQLPLADIRRAQKEDQEGS